MPEPDLTSAYLDRLDEALWLSDAERRSAVEEIHTHVELAAEEMVARGVPRDAAVRQVLERLGAPDRLARDITAAHRRPNDLLTAAGVAFRVAVGTGFKSFVVAWAGIIAIAIALGLLVQGIRRVVGPGFLQVDWTPILDGVMPAAVGGVVAFAIGRSLVGPIAITAHRSPSDVRGPTLVIGTALSLAIGLTAIEAQWSLLTAMAMASAPAWFALGELRPSLLPRWQLPRRWLVGLVVLMLSLPIAVLAFGGVTVTSGESVESEAFDPNVAYAAVGPFVDIEHPPVVLADDSPSAGTSTGPGPIRIERSGRFGTDPGTWTDLRLEVWQGPTDELDGSALDPAATRPLATASIQVDGRRVRGTLDVMPEPGRRFYYVAITGVTAEGQRVQLAWPDVEFWQWRGTALQFFETLVR